MYGMPPEISWYLDQAPSQIRAPPTQHSIIVLCVAFE